MLLQTFDLKHFCSTLVNNVSTWWWLWLLGTHSTVHGVDFTGGWLHLRVWISYITLFIREKISHINPQPRKQGEPIPLELLHSFVFIAVWLLFSHSEDLEKTSAGVLFSTPEAFSTFEVLSVLGRSSFLAFFDELNWLWKPNCSRHHLLLAFLMPSSLFFSLRISPDTFTFFLRSPPSPFCLAPMLNPVTLLFWQFPLQGPVAGSSLPVSSLL